MKLRVNKHNYDLGGGKEREIVREILVMENIAWKFSKEVKKEEIKSGNNEKKLALTIRETLGLVRENINPNDKRPLIPMGHGDPSPFHCFRTAAAAEEAVVDAVRASTFNGYAAPHGLPPARKAVAEYISKDLPYKLSPDDVHITLGCKQAITAVISSLTTPESNILLPRPGYCTYDALAAYWGLEVRHYDLLPNKEWEIDLDSVEALTDNNTMAIVVINPCNPSGSVYSHQHLEKVAETARKLGLLVIADEVYEHITFGGTPFVRMGVFSSIVPVLTLGSISKRWIVPGWKLGWLVTTDPTGFLQKSQLVERIKVFLSIHPEPPTFIQAAVPQIIENTEDKFFSRYIDVLEQDVDIICKKLEEIPCITCPSKPKGSMFIMVKLNLSMLDGIKGDVDFCCKLINEENVLFLPGSALGMDDWLRITFALEPSVLEDGLERVKNFCNRNAKVQM